jgi:hypothetical protein
MEAASLDGRAAELVLAFQVSPTRAEEAGGRQRASEVEPRALRAVENAAAEQRRSGAMLLSSNKEGVGGLTEAGGTASTEPSTRAEGAARRHLAKESSGISKCSYCRSVAEVGERHLPRVASGARKGDADRVG